MNVNLDLITFIGFIAAWPLWLVWELLLLWWRGKGFDVDTISMVAKDRAFQMSSLPFAWAGLAGHWWMTWKVPWTYSPVPAIIFWVLIGGILAWDIVLWNTPYAGLPYWVRFIRFPGMMLVWGYLAGAFLFVQRGPAAQPF